MTKIIPQETYRAFAIRLLDMRYHICDREGHKNVIKGICDYCFRHIPQIEQQKISDRHNGLIVLIDALKKLNL